MFLSKFVKKIFNKNPDKKEKKSKFNFNKLKEKLSSTIIENDKIISSI